IHIHEISADKYRGRDSRKDVPIDVAAHGGVRRPKLVSPGRHLHVFHCRPRVPPQGTAYAKPIISRLHCEREITRQSASEADQTVFRASAVSDPCTAPERDPVRSLWLRAHIAKVACVAWRVC